MLEDKEHLRKIIQTVIELFEAEKENSLAAIMRESEIKAEQTHYDNWNGGIYTSSGVYTYTTTNAAGCDSLAKLNLSVTSTTPTVSPAITQTLVSNLCGARTYRYSAATTANATGYNWIYFYLCPFRYCFNFREIWLKLK